MHACSSDENVLEPKEPTIKIRERTHTNKRQYSLTQRRVPKRLSSEEKLFIILRYPSLILNRFQTTVVSTHSCFWGWWRFTMHTLYKARKTLPQSEGIKVRIDPSCRSSSVASIDIYYKTTRAEKEYSLSSPTCTTRACTDHIVYKHKGFQLLIWYVEL